MAQISPQAKHACGLIYHTINPIIYAGKGLQIYVGAKIAPVICRIYRQTRFCLNHSVSFKTVLLFEQFNKSLSSFT